MQKYAIKIDLSAFFEDERKQVLILVNLAWKNVEALQHHVEELFNLSDLRFLTEAGDFLPPQEHVDIVKFATCLKAFDPVGGKKKTKILAEEVILPENVLHSYKPKKRKYSTLQPGGFSASSTPNLAKRTKSIVLEETVVKKKGKTHVTDSLYTSIDANPFSVGAPSSLLNGNSHVYFSEQLGSELTGAEMNECPPQNSKKITVQFRCALSERNFSAPRIFRIIGSTNKNRSDKPHIAVQEVVVLSPRTSWKNNLNGTIDRKNNKDSPEACDPSPAEPSEIAHALANKTEYINSLNVTRSLNDSSVIAIESDEETDTEMKGPTGFKNPGEVSQINIGEIWPFCTTLKALPNIGDVVLFKRRQTGGTIESDFSAGKCIQINKRTQNIKFVMIDVRQLTGRIVSDNVSEDSHNTIYLKADDMIEPRVYQMS